MEPSVFQPVKLEKGAVPASMQERSDLLYGSFNARTYLSLPLLTHTNALSPYIFRASQCTTVSVTWYKLLAPTKAYPSCFPHHPPLQSLSAPSPPPFLPPSCFPPFILVVKYNSAYHLEYNGVVNKGHFRYLFAAEVASPTSA